MIDQVIQTVDLPLADMEPVEQRGAVLPQQAELLRPLPLLPQLQEPFDVRRAAAGVLQIAAQQPVCLCGLLHCTPSFPVGFRLVLIPVYRPNHQIANTSFL